MAMQANYSTFERELLAALKAINHFLPQVEGQGVFALSERQSALPHAAPAFLM
jgi:hypothetical protein